MHGTETSRQKYSQHLEYTVKLSLKLKGVSTQDSTSTTKSITFLNKVIKNKFIVILMFTIFVL